MPPSLADPRLLSVARAWPYVIGHLCNVGWRPCARSAHTDMSRPTSKLADETRDRSGQCSQVHDRDRVDAGELPVFSGRTISPPPGCPSGALSKAGERQMSCDVFHRGPRHRRARSVGQPPPALSGPAEWAFCANHRLPLDDLGDDCMSRVRPAASSCRSHDRGTPEGAAYMSGGDGAAGHASGVSRRRKAGHHTQPPAERRIVKRR